MKTLRERFDAKYVVDEETNCWVWTASTSRGYGYIAVGGRRNARAHRVAYEMFVGPIPEGMQLDHLCRNPLCVNPAHLEPVTQQENILRGVSIVAQNAAKTHCPQGHPYDGANLYVEKSGGRRCLICMRATKARSARRAAA